jgi:SAM-dependent methyltransferase
MFKPKGQFAPRANAECPGCGSLERTRLLFYYLNNETEVFRKQLHVLHFAPERPLKRVFSGQNMNYIDADLNPNLASTVVDITDMQFQDDSFDMIICSHVLGHVPDEPKALREMHRVLKPGGQAVVITWQGENKRTILRESPETEVQRDAFRNDGTLERLHGSDFGKTLSDAGFDVVRLDYRNSFSDEEIERYALGNGKREILWLAGKKLRGT